MVLERGGREPFGKHAHALADMVRGQLGEADTADDLHARMNPAGAGAVRGGLDVEPVFLQPPLRVILQVRALGAGQQAGAFHLGDLRVEPFTGIGLRATLGRDIASFARGGVAADLTPELPRAILAVDDASRTLRASSAVRRHDVPPLSGAPSSIRYKRPQKGHSIGTLSGPQTARYGA